MYENVKNSQKIDTVFENEGDSPSYEQGKYENVKNRQNANTLQVNERGATPYEQENLSGSQYTQLHLYGNNANEEYSELGYNQSVKHREKVDDKDKETYSEISIDVEMYNNEKWIF